MVDPQRRLVEAELLQFGSKNLKHSDEFEIQGNALAQKVFLKLQEETSKLSGLRKTNFTVAECYIGGSYGKKTDVIEPDLDLTVMVNNCTPDDYPQVLELFEEILILNQEYLEIEENSIKKQSRYIMFNFKNGIEVDLLPASAMFTKEKIYAILKENPESHKDFSSCSVQRQKEFMKVQDSFTHALIRLLKFWFKSLHLGVMKVSGASFMMELVGTAASLKQGAPNESKSMLRALNTALTFISRLDSLKLVFEEEAAGNWRRVPEHEITGNLVKTQVVGERGILSRRYFIVNPVNPWQELLHDKIGKAGGDVIEKLKRFAVETQRRLGMLMEMNPKYVRVVGNKVVVDVFKVFEPQPLSLKKAFPAGDPKNILVTYMDKAYSPCCDMKVRREEPMRRMEVQLYVDALKRVLLLRVNSIPSSNPTTMTTSAPAANFSIQDVKDAVESLMEDCLETKLGPGFGSSHESMDVTLTVPYQVGEQLYAVKLSLDWK